MDNSRPTTHTNNGNEQQPVDPETQQFTSNGATSGSSPKKKLKLGSNAGKLLFNRIQQSKNTAVAHELRKVEDYKQWIPLVMTSDLCDKMKKNGFDYIHHSDGNYGNNSFICQELAKQQFVGIRFISKGEFDSLWVESHAYANCDIDYCTSRNNPFVTAKKRGYTNVPLFRGIHDTMVRGGSRITVDQLLLNTAGGKNLGNIIMSGIYGDAIYTTNSKDVSRSYAGGGGNSYVMHMLISADARVMYPEDRSRILDYLHRNQSEFKETVKQSAMKNGNMSEEDATRAGELFYNSLTHTETALAIALGYDCYVNQHIMLLNGRAVKSERESYDRRRRW